MKCLVCAATWDEAATGTVCTQCGYDMGRPDARDLTRLNHARDAWRDRSSAFAPHARVSAWDVARPWVALVLGFLLFMLWLRACSTGGWRIW